jgi:hypothetical protein
VRRPLAYLAPAVSALALAACGTERSEPADPTEVESPAGRIELRFPRSGIAFQGPANWRRTAEAPPGVVRISSGPAVVAVWAYERQEPLPRGRRELTDARVRLSREAGERSETWRERAASLTRVDGAPAIEVTGLQTISRQRLRTRSIHMFRRRTEYVIDALVPPRDYAMVERGVLDPLLESLRVRGLPRGG